MDSTFSTGNTTQATHEVAEEPLIRVDEEYMRKAVATVAKHLSSFKLTRPEILRVTSAHRILWAAGLVLRGGAYSKDMYKQSKQAANIKQFWSHSWHGPVWCKIALLGVVCNGLPAVSLGTLAVAFATVPVVMYEASHLWAMLAGLLMSCLTFCLWRPRRDVFVDKLCIHQTDEKLKVEGVINMCAFLKHSESMLVCWDRTYAHRLWCILEVAAFLKTHENLDALTIRPVSWGPTAIVLFVGYWGVAVTYMAVFEYLYQLDLSETQLWLRISCVMCLPFLLILPFVLHAYRQQMRAIEEVQEQLQRFDFNRDPECHCCSVKHIHPVTGKPMLCDHQVIRECVTTWFGSVAEFETVVRERVSKVFTDRFAKIPLPYTWLVAATIANFWMGIPDMAQAVRSGASDHRDLLLYVGAYFSYWLAGYPAMLAMELKVAYWLRRRRSSGIKEAALNFALGLGCAMAFWAMMMSELAFRHVFHDVVVGEFVFYSLFVLMAALTWGPAAVSAARTRFCSDLSVPREGAVP
ncbi:unnamed protein product [Symbiodinium sp. CCMP2456]|nr:unnamed protein product [Symbiodinium sp. CCMP2456]